jgi:hypothetical protein
MVLRPQGAQENLFYLYEFHFLGSCCSLESVRAVEKVSVLVGGDQDGGVHVTAVGTDRLQLEWHLSSD